MDVIELKNLTKDYGENRGIFDLNLKIKKGEMIGFVGTNGSGKTTTIRNIMGFLKPTSGHAYVETIQKLLKKTDPGIIIPMHTEKADEFGDMEEFKQYQTRIHVLRDGEIFES